MPTYPAIFTHQRQGVDTSPLMACFAAPVGEVLKWTTVDRLTIDGSGHQRIKNEAKVQAIRRFLEKDDRNSIPTALTVALRLEDFVPGELGTCSSIEIPDTDPPPGIVIDGQHRVFGIASFDPNVLVNVVALINPEDEEIAFQFLVINNKVTKVPTDHLKLLSLQYSAGALEERLKSARMVFGQHLSLVGIVDSAPESPFYRSVEWPTDPSDADEGRMSLVRPAAIEQAIGAIAQKNLPDLADDDSLLEFFFTMWTAVKEAWPELWREDSKLVGKVGIVTLTAFVIDDLVPLVDRDIVDLSDPSSIKEEVSKILTNLAPEFWATEWLAKSLDTSAGRQLVIDSLTQIRRNVRRSVSWYSEVQLVAAPESLGN